MNRANHNKKGCIKHPSVIAKISYHLKAIANVYKFLPITKLIVETASFDIQKIKNPNIKSWEYKNGPQRGFWNVREYVLYRDKHECQHCHGKSEDPILNVHQAIWWGFSR